MTKLRTVKFAFTCTETIDEATGKPLVVTMRRLRNSKILPIMQANQFVPKTTLTEDEKAAQSAATEAMSDAQKAERYAAYERSAERLFCASATEPRFVDDDSEDDATVFSVYSVEDSDLFAAMEVILSKSGYYGGEDAEKKEEAEELTRFPSGDKAGREDGVGAIETRETPATA